MSSLRPPTPTAAKPLPNIKEQLGPPVKLNFVKVYAPRQGVVLKAHIDDGDSPKLFIDLEHPRGDFEQMKDTELHLGISASFRVERIRDSEVKAHVDAYIPKSEIHKLLRSIIQANLIRRSGGRGASTAGFEGNLGASLLASKYPAPAPAPQAPRAPAQSAGSVNRGVPKIAEAGKPSDEKAVGANQWAQGEENSAKPADLGEAEATPSAKATPIISPQVGGRVKLPWETAGIGPGASFREETIKTPTSLCLQIPPAPQPATKEVRDDD